MPHKTENLQTEWNAHQRAGSIAVWLSQGSRLTTEQVSRLTGLTWNGAEFMLEQMSRVLPIAKVNGLWQWTGTLHLVIRDCEP